MADYVVTRKRKRYAVDPCLGYYMYAPSSDDGGESIPGAFSGLADGERTTHTGVDSRLELECTESASTLPQGSYKPGDNTMRGSINGSLQDGRNRTPLQDEDVLTVEAFLQSSSKERSTKTYRYRKLLKRQASLNDRRSSIRSSREDPTPRNSSTGNHCENKNGSRRRGGSKNTRLRKNRKPLKERLYEAAILTHGNPADFYTRPEATENMAQNRPALLFVPYEPASRGRAAGTTHSKALIVDPRKSMAMQTASLVCHSLRGYKDGRVLSHTLDRIPLSKWNLTLNDGRHDKSAPKRKESKTIGDMVPFAYPPLSFVSFQEAEKDYKNMFPGAGNVHFLKPHTLASVPSAAPEVGNQKRDAHGCSSQVPSTALPGIRPGIPTVRTSVHPITATSLRASVASADSTGNVDIDGPHLLSHNPISGQLSAAGRAKSPTFLQKDRTSSLEGTPSRISDTRNDMVSNEKTHYKPLRPLGSFINEFLTVKRNSNGNTPLLP